MGEECSRFARFGFRRHFYQHAGFRLIYSTNITPARLCRAEIVIPGNGLIGKMSKHHALHFLILTFFLENSVDIPHLSEQCWHKALNPQFQYESEESLHKELQQTYGNV